MTESSSVLLILIQINSLLEPFVFHSYKGFSIFVSIIRRVDLPSKHCPFLVAMASVFLGLFESLLRLEKCRLEPPPPVACYGVRRSPGVDEDSRLLPPVGPTGGQAQEQVNLDRKAVAEKSWHRFHRLRRKAWNQAKNGAKTMAPLEQPFLMRKEERRGRDPPNGGRLGNPRT